MSCSLPVDHLQRGSILGSRRCVISVQQWRCIQWQDINVTIELRPPTALRPYIIHTHRGHQLSHTHTRIHTCALTHTHARAHRPCDSRQFSAMLDQHSLTHSSLSHHSLAMHVRRQLVSEVSVVVTRCKWESEVREWASDHRSVIEMSHDTPEWKPHIKHRRLCHYTGVL